MATARLRTVLGQLHGLAVQEAARDLSDGQLLHRFTTRRDQAAFGTLMRRHGDLVWRVCRHVLHHDHDAEDAFQATFLVLVRNASSIRRHEALASWLHGVAYRVAMKAKRDAAIQRRHERREPVPPAGPSSADPAWRELLALLDEEVQRLPEQYRKPFVLCYLEGKSRSEVARELGWKEGTVAGRLARARGRLQQVLARRGVALAALLSAAALARESAANAVSPLAIRSTLQAATTSAAGSLGINGTASAKVATLVEGVSRNMFATKLKIATFLVLAVSVVLGAGLFGRKALAERHETPAAPATAPADPPKDAKDIPKQAGKAGEEQNVVTGQVLDTDGKPIKDAPVALVASLMLTQDDSTEMLWASTMFGVTEEARVQATGRTDEEGRFRLGVARQAAKKLHSGIVLAATPGRALAWQAFDLDKPQSALELRLRPEQIVRGRLIDLEGQAVAGATVSMTSLGVTTCPPDRQYDLDAIRPERSPIFYHVIGANRGILEKPTVDMVQAILFEKAPADLPFWPTPVTTDAQGRFTLRGLDRTQPIGLAAQDDRFARQPLEIKPADKGQPEEVALALAPAQVLEGTITAEDTGKPLPHARIVIHTFPRSLGGFGSTDEDLDGRGRRHEFMFYANRGDRIGRLEVEADDRGHFRANPLPGNTHALTVLPPAGQPYLRVHKSVGPPKGAAKQEVNIALPVGVRVRGKVVDEDTGKPVARARLDFWCKGLILPREIHFDWYTQSSADGTFEEVLPPGSWIAVANPAHSSYFPQTMPSQRLSNKKHDQVGETVYPDAWAAVELTAGKAAEDATLKLRRLKLKGEVVGPDGKPVAATVFRRWRWMEHDQPEVKVRDGRFETVFRYPDRGLSLIFHDAEHGLGAVMEFLPKQAVAGAVTVKLAPCGSATVRFVDAAGKPLANYRPVIWVLLPPGPHEIAQDLKSLIQNGLNADEAEWLSRADPRHYGDGPRTDAEGRLTLTSLVPGATYRISLADGEAKDFTVESGKTTSVGDVTIKDASLTAKLPIIKPGK